MSLKYMTNKDGLVLTVGDRLMVNGKAATLLGFHRDMIRVELDVFPGSTLTVDAAFNVSKITKEE